MENILRIYLAHLPAKSQNQLYHSWQMWLLSKPATDKDFAASSGKILLCCILITPITLSLILIFPAAMLFQNYFSRPVGKWNLFILFHFAAALFVVQDLEEKWVQFSLFQTKHQSTQSPLTGHVISRSLIIMFTFLFNQFIFLEVCTPNWHNIQQCSYQGWGDTSCLDLAGPGTDYSAL